MNKPRLFLGFIVGLTLITLWISWRTPLVRAIKNEEPIFGLLVGTDLTDHARHADTIVLARYSSVFRSLDLLSIPRDTKVNLPGTKIKRINEIYTYAFRTSKNHDFACQELFRAVRWLLFSSGKSTVTFHSEMEQGNFFYAQVDYNGFKKMIDSLGGISVTIDDPMHYDDQWGNLHIHLDPGKKTLNGQRALEYIRFRGLSGDFGRILRQQEFLLNLLNRFKNPVNILKLPQIVWISLSSIKTNLNWFEQFFLLYEIKDLPKNHVRLIQLPGQPSSHGFWIPDADGITATATLLTPGKKSNLEIKNSLSKDEKNLPQEQKRSPHSEITVEVWNASDKKGAALEVVRKLRGAGFDVVKWGNYLSRQQKTLVRDHKGESEQARTIANLLQPSGAKVFTRLETNPLVDIEIIIGEDYGTEK